MKLELICKNKKKPLLKKTFSSQDLTLKNDKSLKFDFNLGKNQIKVLKNILKMLLNSSNTFYKEVFDIYWVFFKNKLIKS